MIHNCWINYPEFLYMNFFQHLSLDHKGIIGNYEDIYINRYVREYLNWIESTTNVPIAALGTGAKNGERILIKKMI